jgi:16S rRNA (guanine527-N7)-methyltransferase
VNLTVKNIGRSGNNSLNNGILYLKGGDLSDELALFKNKLKLWDIKNFFDESFFDTKVIVYLPV